MEFKNKKQHMKQILLGIASIWGWFYFIEFILNAFFGLTGGDFLGGIAESVWDWAYGDDFSNLEIGAMIFLTPPLLAMLIVPLWFVFYKMYLLIQKRKKAVFKMYVLWQGVWLTIAYVFVMPFLVLVRI